MIYNDFLRFINEYVSKQNVKSVISSPWTDNSNLVGNPFFLELDSKTEQLHNFIIGMTDWEKFFYIFVYRTFDTIPEILNHMTGIWIHDYRNLKVLANIADPKNTSDSRYLRKKKQLIDSVLPSLKKFWTYFNDLNKAEIYSVEFELSRYFLFFSGKPMKDLAYTIIKDAILNFPERFDLNSRCHFSNVAKKTMRRLSQKGSLIAEKIAIETGLNHYSLNRALENFSRYIEKKEMYAKWDSLRIT